MTEYKICIVIAKSLIENKNWMPAGTEKYLVFIERECNYMEWHYEITLKSMVRKFGGALDNDSFMQLIDEMFFDNRINWGRIIAMFTMLKYVKNPSESTYKYTAMKASEWIKENGGWDAGLRFFTRDKWYDRFCNYSRSNQETDGCNSKLNSVGNWYNRLCSYLRS